MLSLGWQEMVAIFLAALVLFGPKKLPELGRTIGKAITEFRRASNELKATFDREMQTIERENESLRETTQKYLDGISGDLHEGTTPALSSGQAGSYEDSSYYDSAYYDSEAYRSMNDDTVSSASTLTSADSTTATSSTVGEPAPQGAESAVASNSSSMSEVPAAVVAKPAEGVIARGAATEAIVAGDSHAVAAAPPATEKA